MAETKQSFSEVDTHEHVGGRSRTRSDWFSGSTFPVLYMVLPLDHCRSAFVHFGFRPDVFHGKRYAPHGVLDSRKK